MKTKGIPFWERHLEHMVVGLAVLILLGFAALQFVGSPNAVPLPGKTDALATPGSIDKLLADKAEEIRGRIENPQSSVQLPEPPAMLPKFESAKSSPISPAPQMLALRPKLPLGGDLQPQSDKPFVVADVPAPVDLVTYQYFDNLPVEVVEEHADLKKVLIEPPFDVTWVTFSATFKVGDVLKQFKSAGANGEVPLPMAWYNDRVDFIDVRIEREEQIDGQWKNLTQIDHIPGQYDLRPTLSKPIDAEVGNSILGQVSDPSIRSDIIQPEFYETKNGAWTPPGAAKMDVKDIEDPLQAQIALYKNKIEETKADRDRLQQKLKEGGCPENDPQPTPSGPKKSETPGSGGKGGTPAPGAGQGESQGGGKGLGRGGGDATKDSASCKKLRSLIKTRNATIKKLEEELAKLVGDAAEAQPDEKEDKPAEPTAPPPMPDELVVWGHDISIQPGKTYRYRMTIEIYNPLFAKKLVLKDAQKPLAEKFTLASKTSEWSAPLRAEPWMRVFIVKASPGTQGGPLSGLPFGQATAEVYRFRAGRWWLDRFAVQPGFRIGAVRELKGLAKAPEAAKPEPKAGEKPKPSEVMPNQIDYRTDWYVLDVVEDISADREAEKNGYGATVVLQSLSLEGLTVTRSPRTDYEDPERRRLQREVRLAEAGTTTIAKAQ